MTVLLVLLAIGMGSWVLRGGFIVVPAGRSLALRLAPWLAYARPAALASLLATASSAQAEATTLVALAAGVLVAGAAAHLTKNLGWGLLAGAVVAIILS
jgi:branched-subunit amino acid transport protein